MSPSTTNRSDPPQAVLAVDPGSIKTGLAVVSVSVRPRLLAWALVKMSTAAPSARVLELLEAHQITSAAIEDQYLARNANTLKKLSRAAGRWEEACEAAGIPVKYVAPSSWQDKTLRGAGRHRPQLKAASMAVAQAETGIALPEDVADAYCLGRYLAIKLFFAAQTPALAIGGRLG